MTNQKRHHRLTLGFTDSTQQVLSTSRAFPQTCANFTQCTATMKPHQSCLWEPGISLLSNYYGSSPAQLGGPLIVCLLVHCCARNIDSGKRTRPSDVWRAPSPVRVCFVCQMLLVNAQRQAEAFMSKWQDLLGGMAGAAAVSLHRPTAGYRWAGRQGQVRVLAEDGVRSECLGL